MQKDNNRFETVKKLVHDDPVAMELVNRFHKGFIAAEKLKKRRNILIVILFIASAITLIVTITELFVEIGAIWFPLTLSFSVVCALILYMTEYNITLKFNHEEMDYVNACLEEYCLNAASKYPITERAGKFFANVDGEMRLLDKSYPNATLGEDICMYYVYPLYQLDEYDGITCKKRVPLSRKRKGNYYEATEEINKTSESRPEKV